MKPLVKPSDDAAAEKKGKPAGGSSKNIKSKGGFRVDFDHLGAESPRAKYFERVIYINLDHPQIVAAQGVGSIDDASFRRLAYEVAFSEYSIALAYELDKNGQYMDPSDPIFDIRETINRLATKGASLYSS